MNDARKPILPFVGLVTFPLGSKWPDQAWPGILGNLHLYAHATNRCSRRRRRSKSCRAATAANQVETTKLINKKRKLLLSVHLCSLSSTQKEGRESVNSARMPSSVLGANPCLMCNIRSLPHLSYVRTEGENPFFSGKFVIQHAKWRCFPPEKKHQHHSQEVSNEAVNKWPKMRKRKIFLPFPLLLHQHHLRSQLSILPHESELLNYSANVALSLWKVKSITAWSTYRDATRMLTMKSVSNIIELINTYPPGMPTNPSSTLIVAASALALGPTSSVWMPFLRGYLNHLRGQRNLNWSSIRESFHFARL